MDSSMFAERVRGRGPDLAATTLYLSLAGWIVHHGLWTGAIIGLPWGEAWGRLFVTGQVGRWFSGAAAFGHADLIAAPTGRSFWPTDPIFQLVAVALESPFGEATAWALGLALLSVLAGLGGHALARVCGAGPVAALVGGLALQLHPFWLRNAAEGVTEVLATGPLALAAAATIRFAAAPSRGRLVWFATAFVLVAGTSPYHAVYGALALGVCAAAFAERWRALLRLLVVAAVVGVIFALPIVWAESGEGGRVTAAWQGGYRLVPEPSCRPSPSDTCTPSRGDGFDRGGAAGRVAPGVLHTLVVGWPGGLAGTGLLAAGLLAGGLRRRGAGLGAAILLLGPAVGPVGRAVGFPRAVGPLQLLLLAIPGTGLLGNGNRLLVLPALAASASASALVGRVGPWVGLAAVLGTAWLEVPGFALPAVEVAPLPAGLTAVIVGPTVTFPSADPPVWNPGAWPKEGLWYASHHGGPQAFDYGRGGRPADAALLVAMSIAAGLPLSERSFRERDPHDDGVGSARAAGFTRVLVVRRSLTPEAWTAVRDWLDAHLGRPLAEDRAGGVWELGGAP